MEHEEKLVRLWIAVCAGVFVAAFTFAQWAESRIVPLFGLLAAAFLLWAGSCISGKIEAEHKVYSYVGRTIVKLLSLQYSFGKSVEGMIDVGPELERIGQGDGYIWSSRIVRFSGYWTALSLVVLSWAIH